MLPYRVIQLFSFGLPAIDNLTFHGVGFIEGFGVFGYHISPCCPCFSIATHWFSIGLSLMGCCFYTTLIFRHSAGQPLCDRNILSREGDLKISYYQGYTIHAVYGGGDPFRE